MLVVSKPSKTHTEQSQRSLLNISYCRSCKYYQFTGRRGGCCTKLAVPVNSNWLSCSLVEFPFAIKRRQKNEGAREGLKDLSVKSLAFNGIVSSGLAPQKVTRSDGEKSPTEHYNV